MQENNLIAELEFLLNCEYDKWAQRAKKMWITEGDRNKNFFHTVVNRRNSTVRIYGLKDENGSWVLENDEILEHCMSYFKNSFINNSCIGID